MTYVLHAGAPARTRFVCAFAVLGVMILCGWAVGRALTDSARSLDPHALVGRPLPEIAVVGSRGIRALPRERNGSPSAILFLSGRCPHCRSELASLKQSLRVAPGMRVVVIFTDREGRATMSIPPAWAVFSDTADRAAAVAAHVRRVPLLLVVDGDGNVRSVQEGERTVAHHTRILAPFFPAGVRQ